MFVKRVIDLIKYSKYNAQLSVDLMLKNLRRKPERVRAIAVDHNGNFGVGMNGIYMNWAAVTGLSNGKGLVLDKEIHYGNYKGMHVVEKDR